MTAEILTIGDEILIGQIVNTNSVWMAQQLNLAGIRINRMLSIGDDKREILNALGDCEGRSDFIFITGGLGPTRDDITKKVLAEFFNVPLVIDQLSLDSIEKYFASRGRVLTDMNRQVAYVPQGCEVIPNSNGTASGMWIKKNKTIYISMPGVPFEMKGMMSEHIIPRIRKEFELPSIYHRTVLTQGLGESALAEMIEKWEDRLEAGNIKLAYLPQPGIVRLRLSASGKGDEIRHKVNSAIEELQTLIGTYIYGYEEYGEEAPTPEKIISDLLRKRGETVALAESCTGGYISSLITAIPGSSSIFAGGIIPYSNKAKHNLLQVEEKLFTTVGAVSRECVEQLAVNVRARFDSTWAISVSGIAGPAGGTAEKPVGTVWVAVASAEKVLAMKFRFGDNRERNIIMTANSALNLLRKFILRQE